MSAPSKQPRRRVTDNDLQSQLIDVRHRQELNEATVAQSLKAMASSLESMQVEQREISRELKGVNSLTTAVDQLRSDMSKMRDQQIEGANRIEQWFTEQEARIDSRFNRWETERDRWRTEHEGNNRVGFQEAETKRVELDGRVQSLRENQRYAMGWLGGIAAVGALLIGAMVLIFNDRFTGVQNGFADVRSTGQTNRRLIDSHGDKIHEIELYLARGGERRNGPYNPPAQPEKTDAR